MSSKGKSNGKVTGKRKAASQSEPRANIFAIDLSAEEKKTIRVPGDFWGGDAKQVFVCDVLKYDPNYEFPKLRKDAVSSLENDVHCDLTFVILLCRSRTRMAPSRSWRVEWGVKSRLGSTPRSI